MNGPEHYREAERLLRLADDYQTEGALAGAGVAAARAQAHATLALAAVRSLAPATSPHGEATVVALTASSDAWRRLGDALRSSREDAGLSRRALAEKSGVSEKAIQVAEEGRVPSQRWPKSISRIATCLGWEPGAATAMVMTEVSEGDLR
ncbi:multiprotein-bridging factor 1 family protein [Streptomyces nigra]|uniref:multiprotein-bridging factor 1 family protein n=1 Tax=Streptomyces nigra TaxID=1827580 RepID=UPI0037D31469